MLRWEQKHFYNSENTLDKSASIPVTLTMLVRWRVFSYSATWIGVLVQRSSPPPQTLQQPGALLPVAGPLDHFTITMCDPVYFSSTHWEFSKMVLMKFGAADCWYYFADLGWVCSSPKSATLLGLGWRVLPTVFLMPKLVRKLAWTVVTRFDVNCCDGWDLTRNSRSKAAVGSVQVFNMIHIKKVTCPYASYCSFLNTFRTGKSLNLWSTIRKRSVKPLQVYILINITREVTLGKCLSFFLKFCITNV